MKLIIILSVFSIPTILLQVILCNITWIFKSSVITTVITIISHSIAIQAFSLSQQQQHQRTSDQLVHYYNNYYKDKHKCNRKSIQEDGVCHLKISMQSSSSFANDTNECTIYWIEGRKCQFIPCQNIKNKNFNTLSYDSHLDPNNDDNHNNNPDYDNVNTSTDLQAPPPIILLGGMAQTIESWQHHIGTLSKHRDVLVCELLGQGLGFRDPTYPDIINSTTSDGHLLVNNHDSIYYQNVTLPYQAQNVYKILTTVFPTCHQFDLVAFSLGARVSLAIISTYPQLIHKAHLTGVAADRDEFGMLILSSWKDSLSNDLGADSNTPNTTTMMTTHNTCESTSNSDIHRHHRNHGRNLRPFAWSLIMNTYSKSFLSHTASRKKIESWIEFICATNTLVGLLALLTQTHTDDSDTDTNATTDFSSRSSGDDNLSNKECNNFWHPISMAKRIANNQSPTIGRIHVGEHDHLATCQEARRLNEILGWSRLHDVVTFPGSGHAVCIEQARNWRNNVIAFLSTE